MFLSLSLIYQSWKSLSHVWLFATPWTVAHQALLCMGFSRQEYWSGFPCYPSGDLPKPGIELESLTSPALAGGFFTTSTTWEAHITNPQAQPSNLWHYIFETHILLYFYVNSNQKMPHWVYQKSSCFQKTYNLGRCWKIIGFYHKDMHFKR